MARVFKGSHSFTCTPTGSSAIEMSHICLCLPSCSWYSFTDPGGMEGWVDLQWRKQMLYMSECGYGTFCRYEDDTTAVVVCDDLAQKGNVPKFEVEGHLDCTTCCITQPFTGEVSAWCRLCNNHLCLSALSWQNVMQCLWTLYVCVCVICLSLSRIAQNVGDRSGWILIDKLYHTGRRIEFWE